MREYMMGYKNSQSQRRENGKSSIEIGFNMIKIVRSTHGVNCTGTCSWQVPVKDGIVVWETSTARLPSIR